MSSENAIRVEKLSKCYRIYGKPRDRLLQMLARGRRRYFQEFWALKDISLVVGHGETVGIVGRNGSGKSTLLQLICGTLNPSAGSIETHGRIAALLELGSGFNPEFTGRENVYLNAALLGLSKEETDARYNAITAFADIGEFIEQPVKTYSSGMVVRLAFAVAVHAEPQILVVDEALAVGDELFQRKCFSRIEAIKAKGATVLFVSHSGTTIVELCDRAVLLDDGELLAVGPPKTVIGLYQKLLYAPAEKRTGIRNELKAAATSAPPSTDSEHVHTDPSLELWLGKLGMPPGVQEEFLDPQLQPLSTISYESHGAAIEAAQILNLEGKPVNCLRRGQRYRYAYRVRFEKETKNVRFGMLIKGLTGIELGGAVTSSSGLDSIGHVAMGDEVHVEFSFRCNLNPGIYFLNAGVLGARNGVETFLHRLVDACMFRVLPAEANLATGIVDFDCRPQVTISSSFAGSRLA